MAARDEILKLILSAAERLSADGLIEKSPFHSRWRERVM